MTVIIKTNVLKERLEKVLYETLGWCLAIGLAGIILGGICMLSNSYTYLMNVIGMM